VVVDELWQEHHFPGGDAVGKRFLEGGCTGDACPRVTVVGVVGIVKFAGLDNSEVGVIYYPAGRGPNRTMHFFVRAAGDPAALVPQIRAELRALDPTLPVTAVATARDLMGAALQQPRYLATVVALFAVTALLVAAVGIYGVMSYFVQRHSRDIGIRIALGGAPQRVFGSVVGQGMTLVAIGSAAGVAASLALSRLVAGFLFEVSPADPMALAAAAAFLGSIAAVACCAPAYRASRVDPVAALK
jgi:putative ABC transport system permease protein